MLNNKHDGSILCIDALNLKMNLKLINLADVTIPSVLIIGMEEQGAAQFGLLLWFYSRNSKPSETRYETDVSVGKACKF